MNIYIWAVFLKTVAGSCISEEKTKWMTEYDEFLQTLNQIVYILNFPKFKTPSLLYLHSFKFSQTRRLTC